MNLYESAYKSFIFVPVTMTVKIGIWSWEIFLRAIPDNLKNSLKQNKKVLSDSDIAMQAGKIILDRIDYDASDGKEIFLQ